MRRIILIIYSVLLLFSSCDSREYTRSHPYVQNNYKLTTDESEISLIGGFDRNIYSWSFERKLEEIEDGYLVLVVKKTKSESYFWRLNERGCAYTLSTLNIVRKIAGTGDKYDALNIGDTIDIFEPYGISPEGKVYSVHSLSYDKEGYLGLWYEPLSEKPQNVGHLYELAMTSFEIAPLLKFDTEYVVILYKEFLAGEEMFINDYLINPTPILGRYVKYYAYELSEKAYQRSVSRLENPLKSYDSTNSYAGTILDITNLNTMAHYDKMVKEVWETYGNRVTE